MERGRPASSPRRSESPLLAAATATAARDSSPGRTGAGPVSSGAVAARSGGGRPAAANAARERSRVQTLRHAFLELQRTLPSVPPDTKLSKLDVLLLATTYIAHLTRSLQDDTEAPGDPSLGALRGDGYLHPVKKWPMRSRLYIGATGQFLKHSVSGEKANHNNVPTSSQP
ncbi:transcription factor 24 [Grammomys surdaster]|uniref:transcription factor 24 n=1 Tax=Grammomys surdaster TaxID=491861 RepID=UPI00109FD34A|nr:transcription factor 24 [Grammomys surdaster]